MSNPRISPSPAPSMDPDYDAWYTAFFLKNHIDPFSYPTKVATKEQAEFMIHLDEGERYHPCPDEMFDLIISKKDPEQLRRKYEEVLFRITNMVDELIESEYDRRFLYHLIKIKYEDEVRTGLLIPSRLEKRLYKIFLSRTHIENPYSNEKQAANRDIKRVIESDTFIKALNEIDRALFNPDELSLSELRKQIRELEFRRMLSLMNHATLWDGCKRKIPSISQFRKMFNTPVQGEEGLTHLMALLRRERRKILWLADESGEIVLDLMMAKFLAELNHVVIIAVKEAPFFTRVCLADTRTDPVLKKELEEAHFIHEKTISKNSLVQMLKHDKHIYVLSDGTREDLNLLLASTTFSRVFKEVDCVISRGKMQKKLLIDSRFHFTQDIINISPGEKSIEISFKARHPETIKFSHYQLEEKAQKIIEEMRKAKARGMTAMFYSGIIGSIPGKIDVAKKIMSTFINHLKSQSSDLFIINPSNYYEPGMDADDLMYMWEIVQRSGDIDIWRFQTADDIAETFSLLNKKVPPEWIGKDSTYSTGCTKEMRIAQDVLKKNPEMQLIGPSVDKFMRRDEYGVGSMYDQRLASS